MTDVDFIILAGGKGARLKSVVNDVPKPMADINGKPFIAYLFDRIKKLKVSNVILSVGYKHKIIKDFFGNDHEGVNIEYSIEDKPLGTGGAIRKSMGHATTEDVFILNGDTFFNIDFEKMWALHKRKSAVFSIALKEMKNFNRYGNVEIDAEKVTGFSAGKDCASGLINGGIYLLNKNILEHFPDKENFSFEKDFVEYKFREITICPYVSDSYFIDIGVPDDYSKAQIDFKRGIK